MRGLACHCFGGNRSTDDYMTANPQTLVLPVVVAERVCKVSENLFTRCRIATVAQKRCPTMQELSDEKVAESVTNVNWRDSWSSIGCDERSYLFAQPRAALGIFQQLLLHLSCKWMCCWLCRWNGCSDEVQPHLTRLKGSVFCQLQSLHLLSNLPVLFLLFLMYFTFEA